MPARYNLDDKKIVELYKNGYTFKQIAANFNISKDTIRSRLRENGVVLSPGRIRLKLDVEKAHFLYSGGETIESVANKFNVSSATILKNFEEFNLKRRKTGPKRTIEIDDYAFSKPNNSNCYWAGFIAADGNVSGNSLSMHLSNIDYNHLEKFSNFVKLKNSEIFVRKNGVNDGCLVRFRSDRITNDIKDIFNIIPNKSLVLQPPNIYKDNHIRHYIRGYFDGDGCLSRNSNTKNMSFEIYSGSYIILDWILKNIKNNVNVNKNIMVRCKSGNCYRFGFYGNRQVPLIMKWLYKNCNVNFLERKKNKFKEYKKYNKVIGGK